jgi:hypothetical protein
MRSLIKVKPMIDFKISVTWYGALYTSMIMVFPNADAAQRWAREVFGIEPKIKVEAI